MWVRQLTWDKTGKKEMEENKPQYNVLWLESNFDCQPLSEPQRLWLMKPRMRRWNQIRQLQILPKQKWEDDTKISSQQSASP